MRRDVFDRRFRFAAIVVSVLLLLGIGAYAGGRQEQDQIVLRWAMSAGSHTDPVLEYFAPRYEELTGVRVIGEVLPSNELRDKMLTEAASGTGYYHIGYHSPSWFGYFHEHVVDMSPYVNKYNFDVSQYPESIQATHMTSTLRPGEIISIPHIPFAPMMVYREDFFEHPQEQAAFQARYGRSLSPPATWQELYEVATFFTRDAGERVAGQVLERPLYGWSDSLRHPTGANRSFIVLVHSLGLQGFDGDFNIDIDHPILLEGARLFKDLVHNTAPPDLFNWDYLEHLEFFAQGRLAMGTFWAGGLPIVENPNSVSVGKTGYMTVPKWEGNIRDYPQGVPFISGGGLMLFDTPHAEEAFKFLQWMLEENQTEWARRTGSFSRLNHFADQELLRSQPYYEKYLPVQQQALQYVMAPQPVPEWISGMMWPNADFITDILHDEMAPEQAQQRFVEAMTRELQRGGHIR